MIKHILPAFALTAMACSAQQSTTFSFLTDRWNNPSSTQVGFLSQTPAGARNSSTGFASKDGVTLTFTGTFVGTARNSSTQGTFGGLPEGGSFTNSLNTNPFGFTFGAQSGKNSSINFDNGTFTGSVLNYQRLDFILTEPFILNDFTLQDTDASGYRDMFAAESFSTTTPGAAGTGMDATYTFGNPTSLVTGTVDFNGNNILAVGAPENTGNPNNTPEVRTKINFGTNPISSFSVYTFSDRNENHRISLDSSSFEVTVVPESSAALLGVLSLGALFRRRR